MTGEWGMFAIASQLACIKPSARSCANHKCAPLLDLIGYWNSVCRLETNLWKSSIRVERHASPETNQNLHHGQCVRGREEEPVRRSKT